MSAPPESVFINVPFDRRYKNLFEALIFAVHDCGFLARSAREQDDGSQVRLEKIFRRDLPTMARKADLAITDLSFLDYRNAVRGWLDVNAR